eukprot:1156845-Pelagomonas_calceolata.AAC.8
MGYKGYKGKKPQSRRLTAGLFMNAHEVIKEKAAQFHLHAHLENHLETSLRQEHTSKCDKCDQGGLQDDKHAVLLCSYNPAYSLRRIFAHMISDFTSMHGIFLDELSTRTSLSSEDVFHFLQKQTNET